MTGFHQVLIGGYPSGGLMTDRKPLMLPDEAYSDLQNAYVWRERTKKREGNVGVGQLRRVFVSVALGNSPASSTWTFVLFSTVSSVITEADAQIQPISVIISDGTDTFTDQGNGFLLRQDGNLTSTINYVTSSITLHRTISTADAFTATFNYFPELPSMGICKQDVAGFGIDQTIFFDTKYSYQYVTGGFQQLTNTTWTGSNTDFFWSCNYQGATPDLRYFFVTNNNITQSSATPYDPIRYYNNSTWTDLQPNVDSSNKLYQGLIVIPYYGRLLVLNTWEGASVAGSVNYYARCRFSQIGNAIGTNSWRSDMFGLGGFLDAPTNESIVSAAFYRNTLIVFFEYSTWQLRYVGEYGLPFIFERISSDFGAVSTFSPIVFDQGVMAVSDRGVIQAGASGLTRLDEQIPETVFSFQIQNNGPNFVHGVRDFEKELVYWNYVDTTNKGEFQENPNTVLLFNYRNNTWAKFRDSITCFGTSQFQFGVTWDSLTTSWDSEVSWDTSDEQEYVDYVTCGNQQGFISIYENQNAATTVGSAVMFAPSLSIHAVNFVTNPTRFTVPNHNLINGEIIYITGAQWSGTDPGINNIIYNVSVVDVNTITLGLWTGNNYQSVDFISSAIYIGGGLITLLPKMSIVGKDFNPFQAQGKQFKLSYIDFQMDSTEQFPSIPAVTVQLFVNSYLGEQANLLTGNQELINSSQQVGVISFIGRQNPCQVTSKNHSLQNGAMIYIANVQGMTQINSANYTITIIDANTFSLNGIDSTGFSLYKSGGIWNTLPSDGQTYTAGSQYAWYRFYSTQFGQYLRIAITYDDALMNQLATHQVPIELNAMNFYFREGGRICN